MTPFVTNGTRALDFRLAGVDIQLKAAPLAIRRFTEEMSVDLPTIAMRRATNNVLDLYIDSGAEKTPISITKLCEISDVRLHGRRPAPAAGPFYSVDNYKAWRGHSGNLFFGGTKASIRIPDNVTHEMARISVAHEIGHLLIHRRKSGYDEATLRLPSSNAEEALAEYGARLLLMPLQTNESLQHTNLAESALAQSSRSRVTLHSAVTRLGDPDVLSTDIVGAILWRMNGRVEDTQPVSARLTPHWHLCPGQFIPVGKCKAREGSLVAELGGREKTVSGSRIEDINIGSFKGSFRVDACAWGSIADGSRLVLSVFREL
jgi:hypothetical protein